MERTIIRTIDELGRVVIPTEFRKRLGLDARDEILISYTEGERTITLELSTKFSNPKCVFCGMKGSVAIIRGKGICKLCFDEFKESEYY
jgi:transcriptional pleiotropic regulator of transition state genes